MIINKTIRSMIIKLTGIFHDDQLHHKIEVRCYDTLIARFWLSEIGEERILRFEAPQFVSEINSINDFEVVIEETV